jgi:hypothetical protein
MRPGTGLATRRAAGRRGGNADRSVTAAALSIRMLLAPRNLARVHKPARDRRHRCFGHIRAAKASAIDCAASAPVRRCIVSRDGLNPKQVA